jgi:hypothetical protein
MRIKANFRELRDFGKTFETLPTLFDVWLKKFLLQMGLRALAQTKALTPVDTGELRGRWEVSVVKLNGSQLEIEIYNSLEYAEWIEDGHNQHRRWVPGHWEGSKFIYEKGNRTSGMALKEKFIPGFHMAKISINKIDTEIPLRFRQEFEIFLSGLGVE